jgi:hypothetical protein
MKTARFALLVPFALAAMSAAASIDNYSINLDGPPASSNVVASATAGPVAQVDLTNRSSQRMRCFVDFDGGALTPSRREAWMEPGTVASVRRAVNDPQIEKLNVGVICDSLAADEPIPASNGSGQLILRGADQGTTGMPATKPVPQPPPFTPVPKVVPKKPSEPGTTTIISPR